MGNADVSGLIAQEYGRACATTVNRFGARSLAASDELRRAIWEPVAAARLLPPRIDLEAVLRGAPVGLAVRKYVAAGPARSATVGLVRAPGGGAGLSGSTKAEPSFCGLLLASLRRMLSEFRFLAVQVNIDYAVGLYYDVGSELSLILARGSFIGGGLWVEEFGGPVLTRGGCGQTGRLWDVREPLVFDGRRLHAVVPYVGWSASVVCFCPADLAVSVGLEG